MPFETPITVNGTEYNVRFEREPTDQDIKDAVEHLKDPARGQSVEEGMVNNLEQGFSKGMTGTFLTGPGAVLDAVGVKDNVLLKEGKKLDTEIEAGAPVSRENQELFPVKAAGAIGQMGSMVVTAPLAGAGAVKGASVLGNFFARTRQLAMMGGFQGAAAGEEEAVRLGITDPLAKAGMIMGYGAVEGLSEKIGGYGVETGLMRVLRGDLPTGQFAKRVITGGAVEGFEEVGAGVPQRGISKMLAQEDPNRPGFTREGQPVYNPWDVGQMLEEWSLGATAGGTMVGVTNVFNNMSPQQQQDTRNVAHLPGPLRQTTYEGLQATRAKNGQAQTMAAGLDEATKSAIRLVGDGAAEKVLAEANRVAAEEFAEGWQEREKSNLTHRGEEADTFYQNGQWVVLAGQDEQTGQPVWAPAPNAAELEAARQEWIQTGEMPEQMQPLTEYDDGITPEIIQQAAAELPSATPEELEVAIADLQSLPPSSGVVKMLAMLEAEKARRPAPILSEKAPETSDKIATPTAGEPTESAPANPPEQPGAAEPAKSVEQSAEAMVVPDPVVVAQVYPQSPDLVERLQNAETPAAAVVIMQQGEPVAQLREKLAAETPMEVADDLRAAGADEVTVAAVTEGPAVDIVAAADLIASPVTPEITAEPAQTEAPDPAVSEPRTTERVQPDEFEARLREKIREHSLPGWTNVAIERAVEYHRTHNAADLPFRAAREFVEDIEREMQTPGEQRESASAARKGAIAIAWDKVKAMAAAFDPARPEGIPAAAVQWADGVVEEGNVNAGLNPTLLAAHAIRSADWILTNGRNFGKWAAEQISRFGDAIRGSLRRIWTAGTELLRSSGRLPALTPEASTGTISTDEPANRAQRSAPPQSRRIGSVAATVSRIGEATGVELVTHSDTSTPVVSVIHGEGGTTVSVHEQYAAAVAALNGPGRLEELTKLASFLSLQRAITGAAVRPVPAWLPNVTRQELLLREIDAALSGTDIGIRDLWTVGLEIMMGRPFESSSQRDAALLGLRADLSADSQSAEGWFSHLLRLAAERQAGQLAEQRGGLFEAAPQWRQRVLKTLDSFLASARAGQYGQDVQNVLQLAAGTYQDAAVATATALMEGELINRQIQRDTDQEIHTAGDADLGGRTVSPYRVSIGEAAAAMAGETDVRFVPSAREALTVPEIVQGAPFGVDTDGTAVVALDQVHVTLNDRRRAEKAGTTAGEQSLRRVVREAEAAAEEAALDPRHRLARAMVGDVINAMQSNNGWAPFVNALWSEYGPELQQMVAGSTTEARGEQARTESPSYDRQQRTTRVRDRDQAAVTWLRDNFGPEMEQVLMGERAITEPLTPYRGGLIAAAEHFVRENLQPYLTGVPVRYSARRPNLRVRMTRGDIIESIEGSKDWKDWYERHDQTLKDLFGEDADLFQLLLSATSQATSVKTNVSLALKAYSQLKEGKPFEGYLPAVIKNLERIREGTKLSGQKISAYQEASTGDEKKVVVDRHIARMLFGVDSPSPAQFAKAAKVLTEIGDQIGWTPRQVQAALWAASIRKAGNTPESYDSYLARLKSNGSFDERVGRFIPASRDIAADGGVGGLSLGQSAGNAEAGNGEGVSARVVRNSAQAPQPVVVARKVSTAAAERARAGLLNIAPTAGGAWIGTRAQVNAHLLSSPQARNAWELGWRLSAENAEATKAQADQAFRDWVEFGLDQMEGFSLGGRTYLVADQTFVYDTDGTEEMAARRVLLHEDAHETLQHLRDVDPQFDAQWASFRNQVPASELDDLTLNYPWMADWRSSPSSHDDIFHEWIAHKSAEVEYRGMPAADSLLGQIMQWLKTVWQSIVGTNHLPSDQQILSFLDASRAAKWQAVRSTAGFRYSANKDGDTSSRQTVDSDVNGGPENGAPLETQQRYANDQVLGHIMGTTHAVQHLAPMRQFARFWLGGAHGDRAPVNPENTETAKELAQELLGGRGFAADYIANFQEWYEETNPDAVPHAGDAAVAMLQIELMDYAARLAAAGDPSLMLRLLPTANQAHVGDVNTVEGSARVLQVRSATTQNVIYDVLMDFMAGAARAAAGVDKLGSAVATVADDGKVELGPLAASVDPTLNPDLARDVAIGMDEYADSDAVDSDAAEFDKLAEQFEPEAWRERARELLDPEFRKMDIRLETVMIRLAELQTFRQSLQAKAASGAKASIAAEDRQRFATDPAALDAEIAALTAEATELLGRLSKPSTSHETKGKRKARVDNPKVAAAVKVLSADEKAKRFLERYKSRNKRVRRDKESWEKVLEDQVRNPVDEDMFRANAVEAGVEVETADRIFEAAEQIRAERRAKMKPKAAKPDRAAEKARKDLERYYASIERSEGKEAAVQAKLATQRAKAATRAENKAQADAERAAEDERKELKRQTEKAQEDLKKYYAGIEREEAKERALIAKLAERRAKEQTAAENRATAKAQREAQRDRVREAREDAKRAEKAARELNKFQNEAEQIIDGLATQFSDTPTWKKSNPSQLRELRRQYRERVITRDQFVAGATALNVTEATANQLADLTEEEQRRQDVVAEARERAAEEERLNKSTAPSTPSTKVTPPRLSYRDLIGFVGKALVATPLSQQGDPKWVEETFVAAFQDMGFPRDVAQRYAAKIAPRYQSVLQAAQMKQMEKSAKTLGVKKLTQERVGNWIRSGVFNPMVSNPVVAALMSEAGYAPMSESDFKTLAELDDAINSGFATLSAEAFTKIQRILRQLRPHKHWNPLKEGSVWSQLFVNGALSSLGVTALNWLHAGYILPRRLVTDLGSMLGDTIVGAGKGGRAENLKLMGHMFTNLWAARENFLNQAIHSLATDSYKGRMLEMLNTEHELYTELMKAIEDVKSGSASERLLAIPKIAWLSSDWVRRMLASADQTWGSVIQRYVLRNEAMRMMVQDAGLTVEAAALVVQQAVEAGAAMSSQLEHAGMDSRRAALIGEDQMIKTLRNRLDDVIPTPAGKPSAGTQLITTMEKESATELGNRRGEMGRNWDIPNVLLEGFKSAASAVRKQSELIGRPLTGFVSVGANLLNRSFYFTPLGALRVMAKWRMNDAEREKYYTETMATTGQMRARLYESVAGTIMLMVLEIFRWRPEDKEWGIEVTGNGPQTPALREAWYKQGNKKGSIQLKDGQGNVMLSISYTRGGLDHMAIPLTFAGAHSDMDLEGKSATPKDVNWAWAYTQTVGGNMIKSAQFFGAKALFGGMPTSTKPHALAGMVAYQVQPFLPWGGLQRSTWKMLSGPTDEGSWRSAIASNIPIAQVFLGTPKPAINFLGDQLGNEPTEDWKKMLDRGAGQGFPPFLVAMDPTPENERIYDFLMRKGVAPTTPLRSYLENKNGFLTDEKWYSYVQYRGSLIKTALLKDMPKLNKLRGRDLEKEVSKISSDATKATKEKMKLE